MQQPPAIMQASEDPIEKGSKPAARLWWRIKSSGTLFTVHFVFAFQSASVAPSCRSVCTTEMQSGAKRILDLKKNRNGFVTPITAFHTTVSMTSAATGTFCRTESWSCNIHCSPRGRCSVAPISTRRGDELRHGSAKNRSLRHLFRCARGVCVARASHTLIKAHDAVRGTERNQG